MNYNYNMSKKYMNKLESKIQEQEAQYDWLKDEVHCLYEEKKELQARIDKAIEIIDLIKPELWNISNKMTYRLIDIKNVLKGSDSNE